MVNIFITDCTYQYLFLNYYRFILGWNFLFIYFIIMNFCKFMSFKKKTSNFKVFCFFFFDKWLLCHNNFLPHYSIIFLIIEAKYFCTVYLIIILFASIFYSINQNYSRRVFNNHWKMCVFGKVLCMILVELILIATDQMKRIC